MKRIVFRWLKLIVLIYCLIGIAVYYLQDKIMFHPEALDANYKYKFSQPFSEVNLPWNASSSINIIQFHAKDSAAAKGVVLYFHGNEKNIERYAPAAKDFTERGYHVWMIDYPGFGKSTGAFTEQQLYDWGLVFYKLARARYAADSIVIYGKSMGTGIASQLASIRNSKALILEGPYYSLPSIIDSWLPVYPTNTMIHFKLPTYQYLQNVSTPVTIFHGTDDNTIPYRNAAKLKPFLKPTDKFVTIEDAHHNDLQQFPLYQQKLDSLLR
jgi:alpha-beta hydrolase superfamily lysophospholipase